MNKNRHTAVLMIHGILGKPDFFDFLMPEIPADWTVRKLTLSGHCASPSDFSKASMNEWREQVSQAVAELCVVHDRVIIVAHSMGTLFALRESVKQPIDALFLLNPPLNIRITPRLLSVPFKIWRGKIDMSNKWDAAARQAYSLSDDSNLLHYVGWIPRYLELFGEIKRSRALARQITTPTQLFYSHHDEMVSPRSKSIFKNKSFVEINDLPESGHYYYSADDCEFICRKFRLLAKEFAVEPVAPVLEAPHYARCEPAFV